MTVIILLTSENAFSWSHENAIQSIEYILRGRHTAYSFLSNCRHLPNIHNSLPVFPYTENPERKDLQRETLKFNSYAKNRHYYRRLSIAPNSELPFGGACVSLLAWSLVMWISSLQASLQASIVNSFAGAKGTQNSAEMK